METGRYINPTRLDQTPLGIKAVKTHLCNNSFNPE